MREGLIEVVPEYAGTAEQFLSLGRAHPEADAAATHAALVHALQGTVAQPSRPPRRRTPTRSSSAARPPSVSGSHAMSDLAPVARQLTFGGPPECATRPLCLDGLREVYGLSSRRSCRSTPAVA